MQNRVDVATIARLASELRFMARRSNMLVERRASGLRSSGGRMPARFTTRQVQILSLMAEGKSNKEVGAALGITHRTVASHLQRLYLDREVHSRTAAVAIWLRAQAASEV